MKLELGEAAALAKQGCKHCYGRGYLLIVDKFNKESRSLCNCVVKNYKKLKK
jgi:hypothetical protein